MKKLSVFFIVCSVLMNGYSEDDLATIQKKTGDTLKYLVSKKIDKVNFMNANLAKVCKFIQHESGGKLKVGYSISDFGKSKQEIEYAEGRVNREMSILLRNVSLDDLVRIVAVFFDVDYSISENYVSFNPMRSSPLCGGVETRIYSLPIKMLRNVDALPKKEVSDIRITEIAYDEKKQKLFVKSENPKVFKIVEELIGAFSASQKSK